MSTLGRTPERHIKHGILLSTGGYIATRGCHSQIEEDRSKSNLVLDQSSSITAVIHCLQTLGLGRDKRDKDRDIETDDRRWKMGFLQLKPFWREVDEEDVWVGILTLG